jgi:hypothetical protein
VKGHFRLTDIRPHETVNVRLQFPLSFNNAPVLATALDGGQATVSTSNMTIAPDGTTRMRFQAGDQPGLYRVLVVVGTSRSILKFWIADPQNPNGNPPVLQPGN